MSGIGNKAEFDREFYNAMQIGGYSAVAPHLRHEKILRLYAGLVSFVYESAASDGHIPVVLDLGAGEGTGTLPFLKLGARVVAVDISERQLVQLQAKCAEFGDRLEVRHEDMAAVLNEGRKFDVILMNSVLHHIPDYMGLLRLVEKSLSNRGIFLSFQDPMWTPSMTTRDSVLSTTAYAVWRFSRGDVLGGMWRRLRRMCGIYREDSLHDNTEYHAVRNGVNQFEIQRFFSGQGVHCQVINYCSLHSDRLQPLGEMLGIENTFAIVAGRDLRDYGRPEVACP